MLVSILASRCTCDAAVDPHDEEASVLLLALSPFSPLGPSWAAIGNSLLCCALLSVHVLCVHQLDNRDVNGDPDRPPQSGHGRRAHRTRHLSTMLGRWLSAGRSRRHVLMRLRFPNLSAALVLLLVPGVVGAVTSVIGDLASDAVVAGLGASAVSVGVVFVACAAASVELLVYRHIDAELTQPPQRLHLRYTLHPNI
jgi:hypothetical protein